MAPSLHGTGAMVGSTGWGLTLVALAAGCGGEMAEWEEHPSAIVGPGGMVSGDDPFVGMVRTELDGTDDVITVRRCTGTLIRSDAVLTNATCLVHEGRVRPPQKVEFHLSGAGTIEVLNARKIVLHPSFSLTGKNPISYFAIILLDSPATGIAPATLAAKGTLP